MEIPDYSDWVKKVSRAPEETDTESFKALFHKWDEGKPKEQMHNFLKAYACAVKRLGHFPKLDEIETTCPEILKGRGQNQVVFNLKRRFIQETDFFDEKNFGTKGVYLLPRALSFKDRGGKYSDLIFDFENGTVTLPEPQSQKEPKIEPGKPSVTDSKEFKIKQPVKYVLISGIIAILIILAFLISAPPDTPALRAKSIVYSIGDSNDDEGDFIMLDLANPDGTIINSTIVLPTQIYRSFSAEKGTFSSMSYPNNTTIRWKTDKDSKVKIYVTSIEDLPLVITHNYKGNPDAIVTSGNNNSQTRSADKFQWHFEYKKSHPIEIIIKQSAEDSWALNRSTLQPKNNAFSAMCELLTKGPLATEINPFS